MKNAEYRSLILPVIPVILLHILLLLPLPEIPSPVPERLNITLVPPAPPEDTTVITPAQKPEQKSEDTLRSEQVKRIFDNPRRNLDDQDTSLKITDKSLQDKPSDTLKTNQDKSVANSRESNKNPANPAEPAAPVNSLKTEEKIPADSLPSQPIPDKNEVAKRPNQSKTDVSIFKQPTTVINAPLSKKHPSEYIPEEIKSTLRGRKPERTNNDSISYTLSNYGWSFEYYAEQWADALQQWWRPPADYIAGKVPEGGSVWVSVKLSKQGELIDYKIYKSGVTSEMEIKVIQSLISSFERPALPDDFPEKTLTVNWQFIYLPINSLRGVRTQN